MMAEKYIFKQTFILIFNCLNQNFHLMVLMLKINFSFFNIKFTKKHFYLYLQFLH